jgi:uncharacterized protein
MRLRTALIAVLLFSPGPALAQTPASGTEPKPAAQHQAGTPVQPAQPAAAAQPGKEAPAAEKLDPAKDTAIRHLMDITEVSRLGERVSNGITGQVRTVLGRTLAPDRLDKFMATFSQEFTSQSRSSQIVDAIVPIYAKYFSLEDIKGLTQFYESPLGQKIVKNMAAVVQESQNDAMEIGQRDAMSVLHAMTGDYPELKQILPPDETKPQAAPAPTPAPAPASAPGAAPAPTPAPAPPKQ